MSKKKKEQQQEIFDKTITYVLHELRGESERACAIVGAAYLDDMLGKMLVTYLLENKDAYDELISPDNANSPLGNFGSRITISYGIGLINKNQQKALRQIKRIRNRFAHDIELKFNDDEISNRCRDLQDIFPQIHYPSTPPDPREIFQSVSSYLAGTLREKLNILSKFNISGNFSSVLENAQVISYLIDR